MNLTELKKIKKEKKLTLFDIAKLSGVPKRTVDDIFCGKTQNPRIDTVEAIEKALGVQSEPSLTDKQTRLLKAFNCLIPPMQDYIVSMVEKLTEQPQNVVKGENTIC